MRKKMLTICAFLRYLGYLGKPSIKLGTSHPDLLVTGDVGEAILSPNGTLAYAKKVSGLIAEVR